MKQARGSVGNQQYKGVYEMNQDGGAAPEKIREQGERPKEYQHLSKMKRRETENEVGEVRREPASRRCGQGQTG